MNEKTIQKRRLHPMIWLVITVMIIAFLFLYQIVSDAITSINMSSMRELASHDTNTVINCLNERWHDMGATVDDIRAKNYTSIEDMLSMLASGDDYVDCKLLALTGDDGNVYRSTGTIGLESDKNLYDEVMQHSDKFAMRFDYTSSASFERNSEYILIGMSVTPFRVDGISFDHIFALAPIDSIENELMIESFGGKGMGYIIDQDGYYIVNSQRSTNFTTRNNFFNDIKDNTIEGYSSPNELKKEIASGTSTISTTLSKKGTRAIVILQKMEHTSWYYVSYVPSKVFQAQTNQILIIFGTIVLITALALVAMTVMFWNAQEKRLQMMNAHKKELEDALTLAQQASRAKTTFLNNMSHDIRTPMNAIIGFTTLAKKHLEDSTTTRSYLEKISNSSEHLLSLINDILDMSRIESGNVTLHEKEENLAELIRSLEDMLHSDIKTKQLHFSVDTSRLTDEFVVCDKLRLNQVLLNVISNAIKYTKTGGNIAFSVVQKQAARTAYATYEFCVKDDGIGMSEEFLKVIFEPFTREAPSTNNGIQGTGLGMAITQNIVTMMGGTVFVQSELGAGTNVTVTLDFKLIKKEAKEEATTKCEQTMSDVSSFDGKRILLAEDNELNREIAVELLEEVGFVVETAPNGKACVDLLSNAEEHYFSLILMDIQMPVMDGYAATRAIRALANPQKASIPILALSANTFYEDKKASAAAGMNGHIGKPIEIPILMRELKKALQAGEDEK